MDLVQVPFTSKLNTFGLLPFPDVDKDCSGLAGAAGEPTCRDGGSKEREESEPGADIFHHFLSCIVIFHNMISCIAQRLL